MESLRARISQIENKTRRARTVLPFGVAELDLRLPEGGLALGALHEVAGGGNGAIDGAAAALFSAGIAARTRGKVLWCITEADLFAPGLSQVGLHSDRVIYVGDGSSDVHVMLHVNNGDGFTIACGDGAVEVLEAQRSGKKPMTAGELLRGWSLPAQLD